MIRCIRMRSYSAALSSEAKPPRAINLSRVSYISRKSLAFLLSNKQWIVNIIHSCSHWQKRASRQVARKTDGMKQEELGILYQQRMHERCLPDDRSVQNFSIINWQPNFPHKSVMSNIDCSRKYFRNAACRAARKLFILVAPPGLEPGLSALKGPRVNQLHHGAKHTTSSHHFNYMPSASKKRNKRRFW
jgi:hypothetical protein